MKTTNRWIRPDGSYPPMAGGDRTADKLADVRQRLSAARDEKKVARDARDRAREAFSNAQHDGPVSSWAEFKTAQEKVKALGDAEDKVRALETEEQAILQQMSGGNGGGGSARLLGAPLHLDAEGRSRLADVAWSSMPIQNQIKVGDLLSAEQTAGLTGGAIEAAVTVPGGGGATGFIGPIGAPAPPTSLLDLFRSVTFDTREADVMRRSGVSDAAIQVIGTIKHEASIEYTADSVRAVPVASWVKANRVDLDDFDGLQGDIAQTLRYGVMREVERLLLQGVPASADGAAVPGLLTDPLAPAITATNLADAVGQAKAQLIATGVQPNFVAASPATIEEEEERTGSDGHYVGTIDDQGRVRRLPLVESVALADGDVVVGDSRLAAALGVRQGISLFVGTDQDDLVRNRATLLVEGRWAPLVAVASAVAHFTLPAAP
jgi:hypothetical protein